MKIALLSTYMDTLIILLKSYLYDNRVDFPNIEVKSTMCTLTFPKDTYYPQMSLFCSHALAIGLVSSIHIER